MDSWKDDPMAEYGRGNMQRDESHSLSVWVCLASNANFIPVTYLDEVAHGNLKKLMVVAAVKTALRFSASYLSSARRSPNSNFFCFAHLCIFKCPSLTEYCY